MPKDVIFAKAPKPTTIQPMLMSKLPKIESVTSAYTKRPTLKRLFPKNEIDLEDYREIGLNELLQQGDIYSYDDFRYAETNLIGCHHTSMIEPYYRKKTVVVHDFRKKNVQFLDNEYEILPANAVLQHGDEFFDDGSLKWFETGKVGTLAGQTITYRRRLKVFTDEEIAKANKHYHIPSL